jgi:hypothetical protein
MKKQNPLLSLHEALASALLIDLRDVPYERPDHDAIRALNLPPLEKAERRSNGTLPMRTDSRRPEQDETDVLVFSQMWGSTSTGYGGAGTLGGSAVTQSYTTVVSTSEEACVYFKGGRLAYVVTFADMTKQQRTAWDQALSMRFLPGCAQAKDAFGAVDFRDNL